MKEFYLIPKHSYTAGNKKSNNTTKNTVAKWKTNVPPPTLRKLSPPSDQTPIPLRKIEYGNLNHGNPSIATLLPLVFEKADLPRAKSILNYFEKMGLIKWDENGDLHYPLQNGNIVEIISLFLSNRNSFSDDEITEMKYFVNSTNTPLWLIKNIYLRNDISDSKKKKKKKRTGAGLIQKNNMKKNSSIVPLKCNIKKRNTWTAY